MSQTTSSKRMTCEKQLIMQRGIRVREESTRSAAQRPPGQWAVGRRPTKQNKTLVSSQTLLHSQMVMGGWEKLQPGSVRGTVHGAITHRNLLQESGRSACNSCLLDRFPPRFVSAVKTSGEAQGLFSPVVNFTSSVAERACYSRLQKLLNKADYGRAWKNLLF